MNEPLDLGDKVQESLNKSHILVSSVMLKISPFSQMDPDDKVHTIIETFHTIFARISFKFGDFIYPQLLSRDLLALNLKKKQQ